MGRALNAGEGAAIAVTKEGDEDQVTRIFESAEASAASAVTTDLVARSRRRLLAA